VVVMDTTLQAAVPIPAEAEVTKEETFKQEDADRLNAGPLIHGQDPNQVAMKPKMIHVGIMAMRIHGSNVLPILMDQIIVLISRRDHTAPQAAVAVDSVVAEGVIGMTPTTMMPLLMRALIMPMHRVVLQRSRIHPQVDGARRPLDGARLIRPLLMRPTIIGLIPSEGLNDLRAASSYLSPIED
jgi:hypothetical protein